MNASILRTQRGRDTNRVLRACDFTSPHLTSVYFTAYFSAPAQVATMAVTNEGVLAWCDTIRFTMGKDPGRELFASQIQQHGFDFLDNYLEDVLARQPTEYGFLLSLKPFLLTLCYSNLYELMKTPGKKKDAPKRTRAATAVAAKLKALNGAIFEVRRLNCANHFILCTCAGSRR